MYQNVTKMWENVTKMWKNVRKCNEMWQNVTKCDILRYLRSFGRVCTFDRTQKWYLFWWFALVMGRTYTIYHSYLGHPPGRVVDVFRLCCAICRVEKCRCQNIPEKKNVILYSKNSVNSRKTIIIIFVSFWHVLKIFFDTFW